MVNNMNSAAESLDSEKFDNNFKIWNLKWTVNLAW